MFFQLINEISSQLHPDNTTLNNLDIAVRAWCSKLGIDNDIKNYILNESVYIFEIKPLINYLYQEWEKIDFINRRSKLYYLVDNICQRINIRSENMKVTVVIAFGVVAIGYWVWKVNNEKQKQPQKQTRGLEIRPAKYDYNLPSPSVQRITKQFLVLVISASQVDFLNSILEKRSIDSNDGEQLYELTKYLWTGSESDYRTIQPNISRYQVSPGQESEYDICLVYIQLKRIDPGFQPNVNQLDRYDAFRKLSDLTVDFNISPRLQMEAYGDFAVYNR
ncbi:MAG: hypothetical protein RLZZ507_717 [Cyanobacteriota bacterium]|jgi:hypothetical protein